MYKYIGYLLIALAPLRATTITVLDQNFNVDGGGRFSGYVGGDNNYPFDMFCVDYLNGVSTGSTYAVNVSALPDIMNTRYGSTTSVTFSYSVPGAPGNAIDRYIMAGWLTTQFDFSAGAETQSRDVGIQNAIWTLLDASGGSNTRGDQAAWLAAAATWRSDLDITALNDFANRIVVYTSSSLAGASIPARYETGNQEFLRVLPTSNVPEPGALALACSALILLGLCRRRLNLVQPRP